MQFTIYTFICLRGKFSELSFENRTITYIYILISKY